MIKHASLLPFNVEAVGCVCCGTDQATPTALLLHEAMLTKRPNSMYTSLAHLHATLDSFTHLPAGQLKSRMLLEARRCLGQLLYRVD